MIPSAQQLLLRLTLLRIASLSVWCVFLWYLASSHFVLPSGIFYLLGGYAALFLFGAWRTYKQQAQRKFLLIHLLIECLLLAAMLYISGGATNPLISYYLVILVMAAYSLPFVQAVVITLITIVIYSTLTFWHWPLQAGESNSKALFELHLAGMWLTFVASAFIFIALIPALVRLSNKQRQEIQQLREKQLKNEQIIGIATLAAGTAHELGTPLMTMQMLLNEQPADEPLNTDDIAILNEQVSRCRNALNKLAEAGRNSQQQQPHSAKTWLITLLDRWRLSHPKAQWQPFTQGVDAYIPASPLLDQALLNLLDNAAEAGEHPIQLKTSIEDGVWHLDIMQDDALAAEQLQRQHKFSSEKEYGLGMGLYLSNASVEQFGGCIILQAQSNGGSLCRLCLPIVKE